MINLKNQYFDPQKLTCCTGLDGTCVDLKSEESCSNMKSMGFCSMFGAQCKKACGICEGGSKYF